MSTLLSEPRALTLKSPVIPPLLTAVRVQGHEAINSLYAYTIELATPDAGNFNPDLAADYNLDDWIGTEATLHIELEGTGSYLPGQTGGSSFNLGAGTRYLSGLIKEARFLREDGRRAIYQITIVPWLHLCDLRSDCKVFQNQTVIQILDAVLEPYGFPVDKRLIEDYPERDYTVQYNETDLAFIQRLCQEYGINQFFSHEDGKHRLVLCDNNGGYQPNQSAAYQQVRFATQGHKMDEEYLHAFAHSQSLTSGSFATRDYDHTRPKATLEAKTKDPRPTAQANGDIYLWKHHQGSDYSQPNAGSKQDANQTEPQGQMLARLRMQGLRQHGDRSAGEGNLRGMQAGHTFKLQHHPRASSNIEHLILATHLLIEDVGENTQTKTADASGNTLHTDRGQHWQVLVKIQTQPANEALRPEHSRPKPHTHGPEQALVVGPSEDQADNNIYTDYLGRIKVQFPWDRYGETNQHSSCWVRVSQAWAGNQLGAMHVPRIGEEVLIDFIAGDPDQPICAGKLYNQNNQPPWQLPSQKALSGFRSRELKPRAGNSAGGRSNHLILDDSDGKIQAQLKSDHQSSSLSLGHITRIEDNTGRKDYRGEGFELRTDGHGVIRSKSGMLITTQERSNAKAHIKDSQETQQRLLEAGKLHESAAKQAQQNKAQDDKDQQRVAKILQEQTDAIAGKGQQAGGGEDKDFPELSQPHLVLASPAGIETTTEHSTHIASAEHTAITSGNHTSITSGNSLLAVALEAIKLYAEQKGIKVISAQADIEIQALKTCINMLAKEEITLKANKITIEAKTELLVNGGGSYSQYQSGSLTHGTSGAHTAHAASHSMTGPDSKGMPGLPSGRKPGKGQLELWQTYHNAAGFKGAEYKVTDAAGHVKKGKLDDKGYALVSGLAAGGSKVVFGEDPRNPWDEASYFGKPTWPRKEDKPLSLLEDSATGLKNEAGGMIQDAMQQAVSGKSPDVKGIGKAALGAASSGAVAAGLSSAVVQGAIAIAAGQLTQSAPVQSSARTPTQLPPGIVPSGKMSGNS